MAATLTREPGTAAGRPWGQRYGRSRRAHERSSVTRSAPSGTGWHSCVGTQEPPADPTRTGHGSRRPPRPGYGPGGWAGCCPGWSPG